MSKKVKSLHTSNKTGNNKFGKGGHSNSSNNPDRKVKGNTDGTNNSMRTKATIKRLKMYNQKMPDQYDSFYLGKRCMRGLPMPPESIPTESGLET